MDHYFTLTADMEWPNGHRASSDHTFALDQNLPDDRPIPNWVRTYCERQVRTMVPDNPTLRVTVTLHRLFAPKPTVASVNRDALFCGSTFRGGNAPWDTPFRGTFDPETGRLTADPSPADVAVEAIGSLS